MNTPLLSIRNIAVLALLAGALVPGLHADTSPSTQRSFESPQDAVKALSAATKAGDRAEVDAIFGPEVKDLLSGDPKQDAIEFAAFAKSIGRYSHLTRKSDDRYVLNIGAQNWPMPIPLVRRDGHWLFDTAAGKVEVINRRVGEDELMAIGVCRTYVQAQREYAAEDRDGSGVLKFAQRIKSSAGMKDGLYWPVSAGEELSPLGPLVAEIRADGYAGRRPTAPRSRFTATSSRS